MSKVTVTITQEELKQLVAKQLNLTSDIDVVVVESCEDKPDQEPWITWKGGDCPVHPDTRVEVKYRFGEGYTSRAESYDWGNDGCILDIIAYRIVKE